MNPDTWDFFDRIVCLTNDDAEWALALEEFTRVGLYGRVRKFEARPDIGPHQSFSRSERRILIDFYGAQSPTLLHLEDDCVFRDLAHLPAALRELPEDWDILYLGANVVDEAPERYSRFLYRVRNAWTTHAIAYNRKVIPFLLENQPGFSEQMFDNFLGSQLAHLQAYVVNPMVAWQRPHYSTIWQKEVNYDDVFSVSQNKLLTSGVHLVTYGADNMTIAAKMCEETARRHNVELVWRWSKQELQETAFYKLNQELLDQPRGAGYWAWKPFLILDTLERRCAEGDILIYADAGVEFIENIRYVLDRFEGDFFLFGNHWPHAHWCKRDVVDKIFNDAKPWSDFGPQVQASVIVIKNTAYVRNLLAEWLMYCSVPHLIDDSPSVAPNHPEFQEHRHDQAILTTLAYRENLPLHWWPAIYNGGEFAYSREGYSDTYPPLFHHHRKRDNEW